MYAKTLTIAAAFAIFMLGIGSVSAQNAPPPPAATAPADAAAPPPARRRRLSRSRPPPSRIPTELSPCGTPAMRCRTAFSSFSPRCRSALGTFSSPNIGNSSVFWDRPR